MKRLKKIFISLKNIFCIVFNVFMTGKDYTEKDISSLEEHIKSVNPLECQCKKCFSYYYLRCKKLEKENIELRDRWVRIFGNFNERKKVIETYKTFTKTGAEVNDGFF